ncbi:hypothetical protein TNCV_3359791 [Trichonephila clavipes]|nr:hypothetical protein TNCV_3359791 [Trichonephila clavipes]
MLLGVKLLISLLCLSTVIVNLTWEGDCRNTRENIKVGNIVRSWNVYNICGELRDEIQLTDLPFQHIPKVSDSRVDSKGVHGRRHCFPTTEKMKRFLSYKLFNCFGAKDNRGKDFQLAKLCAFLGLPFLSKLAFRNQERKLLKATERVAQRKHQRCIE